MALLAPLQPVVVAPMSRTKQVSKPARPAFHVAPSGGWINDPNGPFLYKGDYHLFYQHVPESSEWQWGLVWGHAKSKDLVSWEHLPVALAPTPNSLDQHGCFSGCATVDLNGRPSILYTGVVKKPADEVVTGISYTYESQIIAVAADPDDPDLKEWLKLPGSFLPKPPADMNLTGWRDPFVLEAPSRGSPWWYVMIGAGVRDTCGTALVYRSRHLTAGWEYVGPLCESSSSNMWECPIMALLTNTTPHIKQQHTNSTSSSITNNSSWALPQQPQQRQRHMFCVSPDYCVNMAQYWLGDYGAGKFELDRADGPYPLDLGDIMYAPNLLTDKHGRTVMWAWMQEKQQLRPPGTYNSSCCLCVPRVLYLSPDGSTLLQVPLPELALLRQQQGAWHVGTAAAAGSALELLPGTPMDVGGSGNSSSSGSSHMDLELTVVRGGSDSFVVLLQPFEGVAGAAGAGVAYCWATNTLQVIHSKDLATLELVAATPIEPPEHQKLPAPEPEEAAAAAAAAAATGMPLRCGGVLRSSSSGPDTIKLRILVDGSCIEVFTCSGQALGTRVYRGDEAPLSPAAPPAAAAATAAELNGRAAAGGDGPAAAAANGASSNSSSMGNGEIQLVSFGPGPAQLVSGSAWQMANMWLPSDVQESQLQPKADTALAGTAAAAAAEVLQGLVAAEAAAAAAAAAAVPVVLPVGGLSVDVAAAAAMAAGVQQLGSSVPVSPSGMVSA